MIGNTLTLWRYEECLRVADQCDEQDDRLTSVAKGQQVTINY